MDLKKPKNKMINIRMSDERRQELRGFFAERGLSITRGLQMAVDYLIDQEAKGNIVIKETGIFARGKNDY